MDDEPEELPKLGYLFAFAWFVVCFGGQQLLVLVAAAIDEGLIADVVSLGMLQVVAFLAVTAGFVSFHAAGRGSVEALSARRATPLLVILALAGGALLQGPTQPLVELSTWLSPPPPEAVEEHLARFRLDRVEQRIALLVVFGVFVPAVEELFFRGALYRFVALREGPLAAVMTTSVLFWMIHFGLVIPLWALPAAFVLGYLRWLTGSILPSLAFHVGFNGSELLPLVLGWTSLQEPAPFVTNRPAQVACGLGLVVALAALHRLALTDRWARLARFNDREEPDR